MRFNADLFCFMPEEYECISYCITGINIFTRLNKECPCVCARVCVCSHGSLCGLHQDSLAGYEILAYTS